MKDFNQNQMLTIQNHINRWSYCRLTFDTSQMTRFTVFTFFAYLRTRLNHHFSNFIHLPSLSLFGNKDIDFNFILLTSNLLIT